MRTRHRLSLLALLLAATAASSGCSTAPDGPPPLASRNPVFLVEPQPASSAAVLRDGQKSEGLIGGVLGIVGNLLESKLIDGLLGGVLNLGNWQVEVPRGAFEGKATIIIASADSLGIVRCNLDIVPASKNSFKVPVMLRYKMRSATELSANEVLWWDPAARTWRVITSSKDFRTNTLSASLPHFSSYGIGKVKGKAGW